MDPTTATNAAVDPTNQGTTTNTTNDDQAPRYRKAFTALLDTIRSLSPNDFVPINLDVMSSIRTTEGVLPKIAGMRPLIVQLLPQFQILFFDQLEDRALALGHTQTVYESAEKAPAMPQPLIDDATQAHAIALSEVTTLVYRGLIPSQALSSLNGGNGYRNLAADLFKLSEAMRSNWSKISGRTSMTVTELDTMENLADQINQALGTLEQMPEPEASATRDRQAAYTLFLEAYDEVRAAIAYVRRKEGDADEIMPSLYAGRSGGMKKKPAVDEPTTPVVPATPTAGNHDAQGASAAPTPAAHATAEDPVAPSMLTNGPFMH